LHFVQHNTLYFFDLILAHGCMLEDEGELREIKLVTGTVEVSK